MPSASVLTNTSSLSGVTATSNALRVCGVPTAYSRNSEPSNDRSRTSSLLRSMSVAKSSAPSRDTATFWIRPPATAWLRTTRFFSRFTVLMLPSSRAAMYMQGAEGWNATPVRIVPAPVIEARTARVAVSITYTP